jgi:membrane associated rhomboid family serine protease
VLPIRAENPCSLWPFATRGLILANVLAWVLVQGLGGEPELLRSICSLGLVPMRLLGELAGGVDLRPASPALCAAATGPAWYTVVTSMFLHGGWLHVAGNLWFLWIFGNNVEDAMGHARFLIFYLLAGLAAAACQVLSDPASAVPMVGASGAIGGVMGAYLVLYPRVRVHVLVTLGLFWTTLVVPTVFMLGYWFVLQVLSGMTLEGSAAGGGVAFWAHVGGFLFGAAAVRLFYVPGRLAGHPCHGWRAPAAGPCDRELWPH